MSDIKQEIIFVGAGLNQDDSEQYIDVGSSPYRLNVIVSGNSATGVLTNIHGNSLAIDINDHKLSLSNTYVTVMSYYNRLTRKCYYLVYSQPYDSGGGVYLYDNRLFCYNEDLGTLDLIFIDTKNYFDIDLKSPIRDSTMLGDWLYINPRVSEPKMIDVVRAYNYTNYDAYDASKAYNYGDKKTFYGGLFVANKAVSAGQSPANTISKWDRIGDAYRNETELTFNSEFDYAFNVLKMPPVNRPTISYGSDTKINVNNVRGKMFRFSYRYKYYDNTYSTYSSYSSVSLPEDEEAYNGEILNSITTKNYIKIALSLHSPSLIKEVETVVQEASGDWKRIKVINRQEQTELTSFDTSFNFYNNESYITVNNVEVAKVIDYVPKRANSQEIINKNILAYGGCVEGFDNVPKDEIRVGLTPVLQSISTSITTGTVRRDNIGSDDFSDLFQVYTDPNFLTDSDQVGVNFDTS